ncbi:phosphoglucosamine mutase [Pontimonas salivibrio]|uniref:Phosphoglucosamine mutase n=1 Tax=Pontimonas salivibrio TaxID=1159327 RepID=A0A2L2BNU6_9MICO|nr:phosphoglucosamine mutase [Pontimonas salivibrio]AVG23340.1 phosphoglucosamine mutase [Pontimonas salivibrio]
MGRLFGTDGVRGLANADLTAKLALELAQAAASVLTKGRHADDLRSKGLRPQAVIARDPRVSGQFLSHAVAAGLASSGIDVLDAGVLPTPAVALLVKDAGLDFGVMISASHNAAPDNGIKFFSFGGTKLPDEVEDRIEGFLGTQPLSPTGAGVGRISRFADAEDRYALALLKTLPVRLDGLHIVLDCAHGAAAGVSPRVFRDAGAEVTVIGAEPDGLNINQGYGSTYPGNLQEAVVELGADLGIAHDGDADRTLAVDHTGALVDGDRMIAILALAMKRRGELAGDAVAVTVMSNLGLRRLLEQHGITIHDTKVGDRYVLEEIHKSGLSLGGEQSGHIILANHQTTGDGILTGLHLAAEVIHSGRRLHDLASDMEVYPQVLVNVPGVNHNGLTGNAVVSDRVADIERSLGDSGRVLLRPSGTEPLVRVMVEASTKELAQQYAADIADVVRQELAH